MVKRISKIPFRQYVLAGVLFLAASAGAEEWFDAGISGLSSWPVDGSDKIVEGQGTWMGTTNATLVNSLLKVDTETAGPKLGTPPSILRKRPRYAILLPHRNPMRRNVT